jgi:hypothetical protein
MCRVNSLSVVSRIFGSREESASDQGYSIPIAGTQFGPGSKQGCPVEKGLGWISITICFSVTIICVIVENAIYIIYI